MASRESLRPDMNVTPLVDVVLVLLIIFMVVAPQIEVGARVDLPPARNPDPKTNAKLEPITVSVTAAGEVFIEKEKTSSAEMLRALHDQDRRRRVVIKGDRDVRYGAIRGVFKTAREIGFAGVSLQVGDPKEN